MQLHAEIPLLAFAGLVHVVVARLVGVPGRTGRGDDGGIHDGAGIDLQAALLQVLAYLGKRGSAQFLLMVQFAKLQQRDGIGDPFKAQVNARKAAQTGTALQSLLERQIGQVEPVLRKWMRSMRPRPMGARPLPALGQCGSITWHRAAHGTIVCMVRKNSSRRVGLRECSNPLS